MHLRERYSETYEDARPSVKILVNKLFTEPVFTINRAAEMIDMSYPAARTAIQELEADGVLRERTGKERYQEFHAVNVLDALNGDAADLPAPEVLIESEGSQFENW